MRIEPRERVLRLSLFEEIVGTRGGRGRIACRIRRAHECRDEQCEYGQNGEPALTRRHWGRGVTMPRRLARTEVDCEHHAGLRNMRHSVQLDGQDLRARW